MENEGEEKRNGKASGICTTVLGSSSCLKWSAKWSNPEFFGALPDRTAKRKNTYRTILSFFQVSAQPKVKTGWTKDSPGNSIWESPPAKFLYYSGTRLIPIARMHTKGTGDKSERSIEYPMFEVSLESAPNPADVTCVLAAESLSKLRLLHEWLKSK